jgi:hypothetical protein
MVPRCAECLYRRMRALGINVREERAGTGQL